METLVYMMLLFLISTITNCTNENMPEDPRDKFAGSFDMQQMCDNHPNPDYSVTISKSSQNEDEIIIQNLGSYGKAVRAVVQGNEITIPSQEVGAGLIGMVTLSGSGTLDTSDNTLEIWLEVLVPAAGGAQSTSTCRINGEKTS